MEITVANNEIEKVQNQLSQILNERWIQYDLFTWHWWLFLILNIVPWWKDVEQKRVYQIFSFGCFIALISCYLDVYGWAHYAWTYRFDAITYNYPNDTNGFFSVSCSSYVD
ncbi:hypothetical protein JQN58_39295 [Aneurinibacillus sp. BA2021]|nr:hypothetical protein [Aneurinibacillus sp. BA2021]